MSLGPNVKKLIAHKMSLDAIPKGGGIKNGIDFLTNRKRITQSFRESNEWVEKVIAIIKNANEPNPWKNADSEAIASELLCRIDEKKKGIK
uniref:Uncharacterized protein n=1 Tax=viral metagenome TaxID=1070528 RepID=A0A6M3IRQ7_9ZZZZ